ncbi:Glutamate receptor 1.1 [Cardamine amara subsp. amara]|uniref:Glutamate receptor n=1 Tax=Cardamine amara subsp. amara TaxID=228776 RepID=A0ABD1AXZ1_CARAN
MEILSSLVILFLLFSTKIKSEVADSNDGVYKEVRVGLVLDLSSTEGKILETSFALALSDFYSINKGYRTRVTVRSRDSQGDPILALAAATNLLKTAKVEVIVGAQSLQEAKLLATISEKAKVPVISPLVPNSFSLNKYDHFIQWTHDTTSEAKGITKLIHEFNWKSVVVVIYEDNDDWRESLQILLENFQDEGVDIARSASFAVSSSGEKHMMNQLRKLMKVSRATVFVVHMSEILVSRLFQCVEMLGLMEEGYVWILTARTMNRFHYLEGFEFRSMQGVIGFRSYIQVSKEVENFTSRLRMLMDDDDTEAEHSNVVIGVRAHDIACIIATAVEKIILRGKAEAFANVSSDLLETIRHSRFKGLSGDKKFLSETFEIVNIVGIKQRRVGLWSCGSFSERRRLIDWPGGSGKIPRHRVLAENGEKKLLRVLVSAANRVPNLVSFRPDPETGANTVSGFCVEVLKTCLARFNYQIEFIPYLGNYDNLAYLLYTQKDKYDAAVGDITITSNRSLYVDFTLPYTDIGIGIVTVKKQSQGMWTFFDPFEKSLWLASGAFFVLTGIVVWLVERPVNPEFQGSWGQQLSMMLWFGFSTIVFAHREKLQKMSSRFLVIVWVFVVLILTSSYSANLTSTKTISRMQLNPQAVFGGSSGLKSMNIGASNVIEAYAEVLRNGTLSHVINEIPYLSILIGNYPNEFIMTDRMTNTNGFGFMFQKGSDLGPKVSREIARLRSLGMLKDMEKRWFQKLDSLKEHSKAEGVASPNNNDDGASKRFTFRELRGLFIIAGVAHALVLAMHLYNMRREMFTKLQRFYQ